MGGGITRVLEDIISDLKKKEEKSLLEKQSNLRKTDSGEKPNKCIQCGYEFVRASGLRRHLETHSGEKNKQMQPL